VRLAWTFVALTAGWLLLNASFGLPHLVLGLVLAGGVLVVTRRLFPETADVPLAEVPRRLPGQLLRLGRVVELVVVFLAQVVLSSLRVARAALAPRLRSRPAIIGVPLDVKTDFAIIVFANLISLTPGTLSLDVSTDRKMLYVHAMFTEPEDLDALRQELKDTFERRVRGAFE
jgi:multicomponent Na+:H+ antiporter subunit E